MKFRTEIEIQQSEYQIGYRSRVLAIGSCFAQSIGGKLLGAKFNVCVNPIGVLFNPLSICAAIERFAAQRMVDIEEVECGSEGYFHFDFHGSLSAPTPQDAVSKINEAVEHGSNALEQCDTIIITLGTVWVYELVDSGAVVANCHKQPSKRFVRRAMSVSEVVEAVGAVVARYPSKHFIFSVSPVRHLADGLDENSLSKAILRVALAQVVAQYSNVEYFAAYEIMVDDLRDYRFYGEDMLHPSPQAVEYIWSKFVESNISAAARKAMESVEAIVRAAAHRPLHKGSEAYCKFCERQLELIKEHPEIDFGKESAHFRSQLQNIL
ncbi:MAG: GSCFA domain-containing protein [Rikenellaceae bacterium]